MAKIRVWTKQHKKVLENLRTTGRHVATARAIHNSEEAMTMIRAYDWLQQAIPNQENRPSDAAYPVWVSLNQETTMLPTPDTVTLELLIEEELLTYLNVAKWGAVNNCSYIPLDKEDDKRHKEMMEAYGVSDLKACTTVFYPELRQQIEDSWTRVFDDKIQIGSDYAYGLLWEIKEEWITKTL